MSAKACTCKNCAVCGGSRVVCAACGMCTRCHDHVPGCPGCPYREGDAPDSFFYVLLFSMESGEKVLAWDVYVVAADQIEALGLAMKSWEELPVEDAQVSPIDTYEVQPLAALPAGVYTKES